MANGLEMLSGRGKKEYAKDDQVVAEASPDGMPVAEATNGAATSDEEMLVAV